jgi:site-specific DNA-methyltransferase (adenine-specific)
MSVILGKAELHNEDCMELMAKYPDGYFELAIVDPPYGIDADKKQNNAAEQRIKADGKSKAGRGWKLYKNTDWDSAIPNDDYWKELKRVSKNQIVWGGNYMTEFLPPSMGWILWNKEQRDFSLADGELAWTSFQKALRIFDYSRGSAMSDNQKNGGRFHPTQKPVKLYEWLLTNYANQGDKILDTHLGSMSSVIACHNLGFEIVGSELDKDYFYAGIERVKKAMSQQRLFE